MKKIIILTLLAISLTSCMYNDMDDKKEVNSKVELTDKDMKIVEDILEIDE